jgi:hypothetical protein
MPNFGPIQRIVSFRERMGLPQIQQLGSHSTMIGVEVELIRSPGQLVKDYALSDLIAQDSKEVGVS